MFAQNEGMLDRALRIVVGLGLGIATFTLLAGAWQIVAAIIAAILLLTGVVGFCPVYALLRINTRGRAASATARP